MQPDTTPSSIEADALSREELIAMAREAAPTMDDAIAAGDGTLHGAIDHWMNRALDAERVLLSRGLVLEEAAKVCEEREQRFNREDARAACRLCAKGIRALADQINAAIDAAKGESNGTVRAERSGFDTLPDDYETGDY